MDPSAGQPPELTPGLREFLAQPERDERWTAPSGTADLAICQFQVEEQVRGPTSRFVREGGIRLTRVTHLPVTPEDVSVLLGYRPDPENGRVVLARFWFMLDELPTRHRYEAIRIRIKLDPPVPALLLYPDLPGSRTPASPGPATPVSPALAKLLEAMPESGATAVDHGPGSFGWNYQTRQGAALIPRRMTALALLEMPSSATGLTGLLDAEAQVSRAVFGNVVSRSATPVNSAAPFQVPLAKEADRGPVAPRARPRRYDLGLIIPLPEEFDCAREVMSFGSEIRENGSYAYPFSVPGSSLRGIAIVLFDMGPASSGVAAASLLDRFDMPVLALMGIAGALDHDLRLGDVVVASSVDAYFHRAKARPDADGQGFGFDSAATVWRAGRDVVNFANNFRYLTAETDQLAEWRARGKRRREAAVLPGDGELARSEPTYAVSAVASGEIVGAAAGFSRWLKEHHRQCDAIEMEAGGVAQAIYQHGQADMIIVRGISDFADERKSSLDARSAPGVDAGAWRRYAGLNAADLLATMLRSPSFPWPSRDN